MRHRFCLHLGHHSLHDSRVARSNRLLPRLLSGSLLLAGCLGIAVPATAQREFGNASSSLRESKRQQKTAPLPSKPGSRNKPHVVVVTTPASYRHRAQADAGHEMVELSQALPGVLFDLRYATSRNFMHQRLYPENARPWARRDVAERLARVQRDLAQEGFGLKIFDAYRPWNVTRQMWNSRQRLGISARFLAPPWIGSNHNRGVAVDITMVDLATGNEVEMPTDFDSFSQRAHSNYPHLPAAIKKNRETLKKIMRRHGFATIRSEWWHFELANAGIYSVLDLDFADFEPPIKATPPAPAPTPPEG